MDLDLKIQANFHPFWILFFNGFPAVFPQTTFFFSPRPLSVRSVAAAFGRCIAARSPRHAPRDPGQPNRSITMRCASPMNAGRHPATIPGWAYRYWPSSAGARYRRLAAEALRHAFDPDSGLEHLGQGHDPRCLVFTIDAVFRRLPMARTVRSIALANAREPVKVLLPPIPRSGVWLFDRGSPF